MSHRTAFSLIAAVSLASSAASGMVYASEIDFDLEAQNESGFSDGALTSLTLTRAGLAVTIIRPGEPSRFDIYDVNDIGNPSFPLDWGGRSISPWFSNDGTAFVADFSKPVQRVSIDMGDFGGDADDLFVEAYSGPGASGDLLDSVVMQLPSGGSDWTEATLTVATAMPRIASVRFMGGDEDFETDFGTFAVPNSVYYDNFLVAVPLPASLPLFGLASVGLLRRRRTALSNVDG